MSKMECAVNRGVACLVLVLIVLMGHLQVLGEDSVVVVGVKESSLDQSNLQSLLNEAQGQAVKETVDSKAIGLMQKSWPYPRSLYGCLIDRLFESGAKAVAISILFPNTREEDERFAEVLKKYPGRVVLSSSKGKSSQGGAFAIMPNKTLAEAVGVNRIGYAYLEREGGLVRRFHTHYSRKNEFKDAVVSGTESQELISFAALAVQAFNGRQISPETRGIDFRKVSGKATESEVVPIEAVFVDRLLESSPLYNGGAIFKDKLVFVGLLAASFNEGCPTEIGAVNAVEVHAQIARSLINANP